MGAPEPIGPLPAPDGDAPILPLLFGFGGAGDKRKCAEDEGQYFGAPGCSRHACDKLTKLIRDLLATHLPNSNRKRDFEQAMGDVS